MPWTPIVMAFAAVPLTWYVLYRTPFGLRLRAVGENPEAADAAGVERGAAFATPACCCRARSAAIGGAYLSIGQSSLFTRNMTSGRGFIALAALIFGKWRPVQTMLACLFFGFTEAMTIQMQGVVKLPSGEDIPVQFIQMVPYVLTIVVLAGFIGHSRPPRALGGRTRRNDERASRTTIRLQAAADVIRAGSRRAMPDDRRGARLGSRRLRVESRRGGVAAVRRRYRTGPRSSVIGHEGRLVIGEVAGQSVAALSGRAHFYEGHDLRTVTFATRVLGVLGVKTLILTNAAGGVNTRVHARRR